MMVNVHEAKAQLSDLLERAVRGEEVVIAKRGKPIVRLVPTGTKEPRQPGLAKGKGYLTDAFFEPLSDEELAAWDQ
jgi:prevent-host-death family protein